MNTFKHCALFVSAFALLAACGGNDAGTKTITKNEAPKEQAQLTYSIADAVNDQSRGDHASRDKFRNPQGTLEFFGLGPNQNVIEISPGGGWYASIIAPYVFKTGGSYTGTMFDPARGERYAKANQRFADRFSDTEKFGTVNMVTFGKNSPPMANGSADLVLSFRNLHNWMSGGYADKAFADFYAALKPGGIFGIVEHRLPESASQDPTGKSGYVQVSYTKALAAKAGFEFVGASEINANPKDTADHPVGVWTLPPVSASPKEGEPGYEGFDAAKYKAIGESDRYTLKFRKPM